LAQLNHLLAEHPCFFDGARLTRLSAPDSPVYALLRESAEGKDSVLVLVNTDSAQSRAITLFEKDLKHAAPLTFDLLGQIPPPRVNAGANQWQITLAPGDAYCLSPNARPQGLHGNAYRRTHAQAAWAIQALSENLSVREIGAYDTVKLAQWVEECPFDFLATVSQLDHPKPGDNLHQSLERAAGKKPFPRVVRWNLVDRGRVTLVLPDHW